MSLLRLAVLITIGVSDAYYWMPHIYDLYDFEPHYDVYNLAPVQRQPQWVASSDAYMLKARLPDIVPTSLSASLASDGTKIEIMGERKLEGCSCQPTTVKEIALPYRPRAEDIDISVDGDSQIISLRLMRHAKVDTAVPLKLSLLSKNQQTSTAEESSTQPLRFVPHESAATSASDTSLHAQEHRLSEKFRSAALASIAVQNKEATGPSAAKQASGGSTTTTAEGELRPSDEPTPHGAA